TIGGFYASLDPVRRGMVDATLERYGITDAPHWALIRLAYALPARLAMIQAQDPLGLGSEARMNIPGAAEGAWEWRLPSIPSLDVAQRLREAAQEAGRAR